MSKSLKIGFTNVSKLKGQKKNNVRSLGIVKAN